jgi:anaerobic magnesium-protoporphyrin IX monomethyl ester cyclase
MVDILLIQPPIRDFYLTRKRTIPYGLASIAAALMEAGFSVEILDGLASTKSRPIELPVEFEDLRDFYGRPDRSPFGLFYQLKHFGYSFDTLAKKARQSGAWLVGIASLFTPYAPEALKTAEMVKAHHPACRIVVGGHHATAQPEHVLQCRAVDFVIRGEGEAALPQLARAIRDNLTFENIPGIVFRRSDGSLHLNAPASMPNLDSFPLPAMELVNQEFYRRRTGASTVIVTSRGCPMACSYCSVGAHSYRRYQPRSVAAVIQEIKRAVDGRQVRFVDFEDENLSVDRSRFLELLRGIKDGFPGQDLELRAMNGLYPPSLDDEVVATMKAAGFKCLNLSLGSASTVQLQRFCRPDITQPFDEALLLAEKHGLAAVGYILIGAPFQDPCGSLDDLLYLARRRVLAGVSVFYPAPGSVDYDRCKALGLLPNQVSRMRASVLPISHTTSRTEAATLLRLGRILNFMKALIDENIPIPKPEPAPDRLPTMGDRLAIGLRLLQMFLHDGRIRGVEPDGRVYQHLIAAELSVGFIQGLQVAGIRGYTSNAAVRRVQSSL